MILFLTLLTILGLSLTLIAAYLVYIIQDTIKTKEKLGEYEKEDAEEYMTVMSVSYTMFFIVYIIGSGLVLSGTVFLVYKILVFKGLM